MIEILPMWITFVNKCSTQAKSKLSKHPQRLINSQNSYRSPVKFILLCRGKTFATLNEMNVFSSGFSRDLFSLLLGSVFSVWLCRKERLPFCRHRLKAGCFFETNTACLAFLLFFKVLRTNLTFKYFYTLKIDKITFTKAHVSVFSRFLLALT